MPDYNPNEVAKVKHLLSLAQSINDKIDGVTVTPVVKSTPTLSISSWSKADTVYSAAITYNGDGTLSTSLGSISGNTLTVTDDDGTFSGTLTATAGTSYAATTLSFSHDTEEPAGQKLTPMLDIGSFFEQIDQNGFKFMTSTITYTGDGELYLNIDHIDDEDLDTGQPHPCGFIYDYTLYILYDSSLESPPPCSVTIYASEGENYAARSATFTVSFT